MALSVQDVWASSAPGCQLLCEISGAISDARGARATLAMLLNRCWVATLLVTATAAEVREVDAQGMMKLVMEHDKAIFLMHAGKCARAEEFMPALETIAGIVKTAIARIDVSNNERTAMQASGVLPGTPMLKALFRNAPPGKRVLEYAGPAQLDSVLAWAKAVDEWDGSSEIPSGWKVGLKEEV